MNMKSILMGAMLTVTLCNAAPDSLQNNKPRPYVSNKDFPTKYDAMHEFAEIAGKGIHQLMLILEKIISYDEHRV